MREQHSTFCSDASHAEAFLVVSPQSRYGRRAGRASGRMAAGSQMAGNEHLWGRATAASSQKAAIEHLCHWTTAARSQKADIEHAEAQYKAHRSQMAGNVRYGIDRRRDGGMS